MLPDLIGAFFMGKNIGIIEKEGLVTEALPNASFKVKLSDGSEVLGIISGKMRRYNIRILPGDRVKLEFSEHDLTRGRIVFRTK